MDGKAGVAGTLRVDLFLQNTKRTIQLNRTIDLTTEELKRLEDLSIPESDLRIKELIIKIDNLRKERLRQLVLVKEVRKIIPLQSFSCLEEWSYESSFTPEILKLRKNKISVHDYNDEKSHSFVKNGRRYGVHFLKGKNNKRIPSRLISSFDPVESCSENPETDFEDDMLPSWVSGRRINPLFSTYESASKCTIDGEPVKCKVSVSLSAGPCDGRHSTDHKWSPPLGNFRGLTQNVFYDVPATDLGMPYTYVAPDNSGDVVMHWTFVFPDGVVVEPEYLLRIFVPGLVNLNDTPGIDQYLDWEITSHNHGTYGVAGFGGALLPALQLYAIDAISRGVPIDPDNDPETQNHFLPLKGTGLSLQFGGLFDINKDWAIPHSRHRQGVDLDIGMARLSAHPDGNVLKNILRINLFNAGFMWDVRSESWRNPNSSHWHIRYPRGEIVDSNGGR